MYQSKPFFETLHLGIKGPRATQNLKRLAPLHHSTVCSLTTGCAFTIDLTEGASHIVSGGIRLNSYSSLVEWMDK